MNLARSLQSCGPFLDEKGGSGKRISKREEHNSPREFNCPIPLFEGTTPNYLGTL
jgi:hypothetical protein